MIVTITPKGGKPIKKKIATPEEAIQFINSFAGKTRCPKQRAADCCPRCGANDWRDAIVPDTLEICNVCGNSR